MCIYVYIYIYIYIFIYIYRFIHSASSAAFKHFIVNSSSTICTQITSSMFYLSLKDSQSPKIYEHLVKKKGKHRGGLNTQQGASRSLASFINVWILTLTCVFLSISNHFFWFSGTPTAFFSAFTKKTKTQSDLHETAALIYRALFPKRSAFWWSPTRKVVTSVVEWNNKEGDIWGQRCGRVGAVIKEHLRQHCAMNG